MTYPPKLEPIPVKPLFFDAAWNYIEYLGREAEKRGPVVEKSREVKNEEKGQAQTAQQQKKGWFGFGK